MGIKYVLIGCGRIAPAHINAALKNQDQFSICAVCDTDKSAADALLSKFNLSGRVKIYTDYREMISSEKPDIAAVATESGYHAAIALYCIEQGVNVMIEKPVALSMQDARRMNDAAKEHSVLIATCHQNRFNPPVQMIKKAVDDGRFGKISHASVHIRWNRGKNYYKSAVWRGTWRLDGGALMNQCIHAIDVLRWVLGGDVEEICAYTENTFHPYIEAEDLGVAIVRFKNGALATIEGSTNVYPNDYEETLSIFGENGSAKIGGLCLNRLEHWDFKDIKPDETQQLKQQNENPPDVYGFGHISLYRDVANAVLSGGVPYVDGAEGMRALEMILAIYESARQGSPVKFPLGSISTLDYEGMFK